MLRSHKVNFANFFWIIIIFSVSVSAFAILLLGDLVNRNIESAMVLHDFFTVIAIMSGASIIGILVFSG